MEVPTDPGKPQMCNFAIVLKVTHNVRDNKAEIWKEIPDKADIK